MGLETALPVDNILTTQLNRVINWSRRSSLWPMPTAPFPCEPGPRLSPRGELGLALSRGLARLTPGIDSLDDPRQNIQIHRRGVFGFWEAAASDLLGVGRQSRSHLAAQLQRSLGVARNEIGVQPQ